ncbi:hypothetical protein GGS26DRAFT_491739 [Hypomontagnella submonticulosa]|nr:hypothetical protein GGS26DRAFT_491739 [Hypomontagnella submonticulosa]
MYVHGLIATLAVLTSSAWALPRLADAGPGVTTTESAASNTQFAPIAVASLTEITSLTGTLTTGPSPTVPPSGPESTTFTGHCDYSFCTDGSKVCFYWAGYTSWDVSRGPIPGEIPTVLGPCTD